jgi:hypothetical protein
MVALAQRDGVRLWLVDETIWQDGPFEARKKWRPIFDTFKAPLVVYLRLEVWPGNGVET